MSDEGTAGVADAAGGGRRGAVRRARRIALGVLCVLAAAAVAFRGEARPLLALGMEWVGDIVAALQAGGPWLFFAGMALLPALGMPMLAFSLTAAPAFSARIGLPGTVAAALAAVTINLLLTYGLARRALRPLLEGLIERFGYRLPQVESADATDLIVIVRVTPGIPFFVQNYLLGLAEAPLGRYVAISCAAQWAYTVAFILFGDALRRGSARVALGGVAIVIVAAAATHLVRRHYASRKSAAAGAR